MGCASSKSPAIGSGKASFQKLTNLSQHEIELRIDAPRNADKFTHSGIEITYAWASQRGYYPDAPDKDNQDSYSILPQIKLKDGSGDVALFGVYDGHGTDGHLAARYVRNQLTTNLIGMLIESPSDGKKATEKAILKAHKITNERLHTDSAIDTSSSGTTSITVLLQGRTMYVNNVGDSRAIIVSSGADKQIKVHAMSSDHTPYRKDERFRVMKYGARILSMDQMIQNDIPADDNWGDITLGDDIDEAGDPPRVWAQNGDFPGTAFTRSLGDKMAEELGVTAEPEILVREIQCNDKYIAIASDGVFEFMTNQMVADIIAEKDDPLDACRAVIAAAYELWLRYDVRTDDITIIILRFEDMIPNGFGLLSPDDITLQNQNPPYSPYGEQLISRLASSAAIFGSYSPPLLNPTPRNLEDSRPVRREISREKKKKLVFFMPFLEEEEDESQIVSAAVIKTEKDAQAIAKAIKLNSLFQHLNSSQRSEVISLMQPLQVKEGDWVITQGEEGDKFYVIDHGRFEVRVKAAGSDEQNGGNVVHVYESGRDQHPGFGELSLLYGKPRAASVIALTNGTLWYLDHKVFKRIVMRSIDNHKLMQRILRKVNLFSCFNMEQIRRIVTLLSEEKFLAGEYLTLEGERSENFYVILKGEVKCVTRDRDGVEICFYTLKKDDHFGEHSLLSKDAIAECFVLAKTDVKVLFVGRRDFENHLGKFSDKVELYKAVREADILSRVAAPTNFSDLNIMGLISSDNIGSILLGSFGPIPSMVTVRSYLLNEVSRLKASAAALNSMEAYRVINSSTQKNSYVFSLLSVCHDTNALHLIMNVPVVADLDSLLMAGSHQKFIRTSEEVVIYVATCVFSALEFIHGLGIICRAIQPEALYVDLYGRIVLGTFRVCKVGTVGGKTYTIAGTTDYLAPEQIGRQGHSASVDLWSLGVVLYELATGVHPFNEEGDTELMIHSKISSYGTRAFPKLSYPDFLSRELVALIDRLLVPVPEMRLGAGLRGYDAVKEIFNNLDWEKIRTHPPASPLATAALSIREDMLLIGVQESLLAGFSDDYVGDPWAKSVQL